MKTLLAITMALLSTAASAQSPTSYTIVLAPPQLDLIGKALGKLPYEDAYQVIEVVKAQVLQQQNAAAEAAKPKPQEKPQ